MGAPFRFGAYAGGYTPPRRQPGFLVRDSYLGEEIDPDLGISARNRGLVGFGTALLAGAGSNDYGQTLARGIDAFATGQDETLQRGVAMERQRKADERAKAEAEMQRRAQEESILASQQGRDLRGKDQARQEELWKREDLTRKTKPEAAADLISSIESVAGLDSPEAKQARALARMGEDVDLAALDRLHREALDWSRKDDEYEMRLKFGRQEDEEQAKRGYGPIAAAQMDRERLELERRRLARAEAAGDGGGGISVSQARLAAKDDYDAKKAAHVAALKDWQERNKYKFAPDPKDPKPTFDFDKELRKSKRLVEEAYGVRLPGSDDSDDAPADPREGVAQPRARGGAQGGATVRPGPSAGPAGTVKVPTSKGVAVNLSDLKAKSRDRNHARQRLQAGGIVGEEAERLLSQAGW